MFRNKTLFIVGAGASSEVGLPLGEALKGKVARLLTFDRPGPSGSSRGDAVVLEALRLEAGAQGVDVDEYLTAADKLRRVLDLSTSIDNVLHARSGDRALVYCGKVGILRSILEEERQSSLHPYLSGGSPKWANRVLSSWLAAFFKMTADDRLRKATNSTFMMVDFIVYNYDRCLEAFLQRAFREYFELEIDHASRVLNSVKFLHPHGSVGRLPWQDGNSPPIDFGQLINGEQLRNLVQGMRTFSESPDDSLRKNIQYCIAEAETVVFVGFGYDPHNMEMLRDAPRPKARRMFGTAFGESPANIQEIQDLIYDTWRVNRRSVPVVMSTESCRPFLRAYSRTLTS